MRYFETTNRKLELFTGDKVFVKIKDSVFTSRIDNELDVNLGGSDFSLDWIIKNGKIKKASRWNIKT